MNEVKSLQHLGEKKTFSPFFTFKCTNFYFIFFCFALLPPFELTVHVPEWSQSLFLVKKCFVSALKCITNSNVHILFLLYNQSFSGNSVSINGVRKETFIFIFNFFV